MAPLACGRALLGLLGTLAAGAPQTVPTNLSDQPLAARSRRLADCVPAGLERVEWCFYQNFQSDGSGGAGGFQLESFDSSDQLDRLGRPTRHGYTDPIHRTEKREIRAEKKAKRRERYPSIDTQLSGGDSP